MDQQVFEAFELGQTETIHELLLAGGNVNATNSDGNTLLHLAILENNPELVKLLIDLKANVNIQNNKNQTAMNIAFNHRFDRTTKSAFMKMLIEAGADIKIKNNGGERTLLHEAALSGDAELVQLLIRQGANVTSRSRFNNWTVLHYAAFDIVSQDPSIFEILLSAGANVDAKGRKQETALHILSGLFKPKLPALSLCKIVEVFHKYGADFDAYDEYNLKPIHYAVTRKHSEAVKALILCGGVNINKKINGIPILNSACANFNEAFVKFLLKNGANVNAVDDSNSTALQQAILSVSHNDYPYEDSLNQEKILKHILKRSPDVNVITKDGYNILSDPRCNLPKFSWKLIIEHIAKLQAFGSLIHHSLLETICNRSDYKNYYETCIQELNNAENKKLYEDSWINFLTLLKSDKYKLIQYAGNKDLTKSFNEFNITKEFPIYGVLIEKKFSKAIKKRLIWDKAANALSDLLPLNIDPDHRVIAKILSFFNFENLPKLYE